MIDVKQGFIREGELIAQRIKMWTNNAHRVALWSIQDTEFNTVKYILVNTQTSRAVESLSLEYLEKLYDMCIQYLMEEYGARA